MPRGGKREGTPGVGYSNRTDLTNNYDQAAASPAAGGLEAAAGPPQLSQYPEDTPNLTAPTAFPDEPVTAGLSVGPGPGPNRDTRPQETAGLKMYLPLIAPYLDRPETPDSVRTLFRYIRGA
jgi:hypothetical protein